VATQKQQAAARKNVKEAAGAAKAKKSLAHLPAKTKTALGKQGAAVAARKRSSGAYPGRGPSCTRRPSGATSRGGRRWAAPNWRAASATDEAAGDHPGEWDEEPGPEPGADPVTALWIRWRARRDSNP